MANYTNEWIKDKKAELVAKFGGCCAYCGTTVGLEFAHIKHTSLSGMGRGRKERYYDVMRNPDAYVLLCGDVRDLIGVSVGCHKKFDRGEITLEDILAQKKNGALYVELR